MPHDDLTDLPDGVRNNLPGHAQEIGTRRGSTREPSTPPETGTARGAAPTRSPGAAVENAYEKNENGGWVEKKG